MVCINELKELNISDMIYEIRGKQVMLDSDLARVYECTNGTKDINKAVKRNIERFPEEFYFQLTEKEQEILWFQIGTKKNNIETRGGRFKNPHVFTEQGVAMLSSVLHTEKAVSTSIKIMKAFVTMRHYFNNTEYRLTNIETKVLEHDNSIKLIQELFKEDKEYYFDKEYDAYSKILDIFNKSKNELIIVDRFTDKSLLDIIKNLKCKVILITSNKTNISELDIEKYNKTYNNLSIYYDDSIHDRYFILDRKDIYLCGSSINYIGYRKTTIIMMNDKNTKNSVMNAVLKIIK